jgi:hypothetical protein
MIFTKRMLKIIFSLKLRNYWEAGEHHKVRSFTNFIISEKLIENL